MSAHTPTYRFDQAWRQERDRLRALEALFDLVPSRAVLEPFTLASTHAPVEDRKAVCVRGHVRTPFADARPARHRTGREDR
jgi:hypothetical protein